ncbi:MAG: choice-of-anchor Q domain-containing protein, partial [Bacteroidota bacterium]
FALSNSMVVSNGGPKEPDLNFVKSKVMQNEANIFGKVTGMKVSNVDMTHSRVVSDITQIGLSDKLTKVSGKLPVLKLMSGSVAIDNADTNSSLKEDINGNPRSKADIGAVEVN